MKKNRKTRSFANRLTRKLVLTLLIVMGLTSFLVFMLGGSFASEVEGMRHEALLDVATGKISKALSDVYVGTVNHVPEIEESIDKPEHLFDVMEWVVRQNPRIRSCGISFIADYYPQKGHWFCPYAVRDNDGKIEVRNIGGPDFDYLQREWFVEALNSKEGLWSKPFFEGNDTITPLVSYLVPIRDKQGRTVAVLGADLSLDWLKDKVDECAMDVYKNEWLGLNAKSRIEREREGTANRWKPYCFIITSDGTFLVHPDGSRVVKDNFSSLAKAAPDTITAYIGRQMMEGKKGYYGKELLDNNESCDFDGRDCYVFYSPIKYANWSVGLVVPSLSIDIIAYALGGMLGCLVLLSLLVVFLVCRHSIKRTTQPLKELAASADEVAKGNFATMLPEIKYSDEIRNLRDSFEDMQHSLSNYIAELKETTASKAAIENELRVAHDIQMSMLPKAYPSYPEREDIDIFGSLTPAKDVGGDLLDFYIREDLLFFCIGDVSGKGVPASLVMAVVRSLFRNISGHTSDPVEIVTSLNDALSEDNDTNMFVTFFVGVLNLSTGILRYCNAGHDAPMLIGQGVGMLPCDPNLPIGVMYGWNFSVQEISIAEGTTIFLYTDGLNEAENVEHAQFGVEPIKELAKKLLAEGKNVPHVVIDKMTEAVHAFVGEAEQSDDLTMLAIKYIHFHGNQE